MIYLELFWTFFKIGAFTFGGGYAMLPLIQTEVEANGWLSSDELINFIAVSESTPGPFAVNISTYVGAETGGVLGSLCATFGVVLPSFIIILLVAKCFASFKDNSVIKGCMSGLKPAVIGLIGAAVLSTGKTVFFPDGVYQQNIVNVAFLSSVGIFLLMIFLLVKKVHPIVVIVVSGVLGVVVGVL